MMEARTLWICNNVTVAVLSINFPREDDAPEYHGCFVTYA